MTYKYLFDLDIGQGHDSRSKFTDVEVSAFSECFLLGLILYNFKIFYFQSFNVPMYHCMYHCIYVSLYFEDR